MTLKKSRKDKRESHSSRGLLDDNPHKLKERPSWLGGISRQPSSNLSPSGSWRQVTCTLQDDASAGQASLRLYTEDQHLQHSVNVNALFGPNLRIVDPTLLSRRHVLAIYGHTPAPASSSTGASTPSCEPIYLAFRSRETLHAWLVLLRSFARPDIRPRLSPSFPYPQAASYRIWRQLQVSIMAGRKLPTKGALDKMSSDESNPKDDKDRHRDKWEGLLEVTVNGATVGRTGYKFLPGPAWHAERVTVMDPDLGGGTWAGSGGADVDSAGANLDVGWGGGAPLSASALLEIRIWRAKPALFGLSTSHTSTVPIDLGPFRRGEPIKAWWPGYPRGNEQQDGELLLEVKFDEEIVLPLEAYHKMKEILARQNYFELWQNLTARIPIPTSASTHLISLALYHGTLASHLSALAYAEINSPRTSPSTLFRGNSLLTRVAESTMAMLGARGFLENSVGHIVRKMCRDKVVFDVGMGGSTAGMSATTGATEGADLMAHWLREIWKSIWRARNECPEELRQLFYHIRTYVEARWGSSNLHTDLKYQAISAFLFLRFFIPALLQPDQHSFIVGPPPEGVERSLKSLARALQSLANLNTNVQREEFMRNVKSSNEENVGSMVDYLLFVSTPSDRPTQSHSSHPPSGTPPHTRLTPEHQIVAALQARLPNMSPLQRESLPALPHMIDEARDLAAIASAVVRNVRTPREPGRTINRETGPMNEGLEGSDDERTNISNVDAGDEQNNGSVEVAAEVQSEAHQDMIRFIKACFDVQAEAMRRAMLLESSGGLRKHPRRRRRHKREDKPRPEERVSMGTSTPSVEEGSVDGREFGHMATSFMSSMSGIGTDAGFESVTSQSDLISTQVDPSTKSDIRELSQTNMSGTAKRKRMFPRFMQGSRK